MKYALYISRLLVGALFLFSGFVKAVDPLGFSYKMDKYFVVFEQYFFDGIASLSAISLYLSIFICALEILLGWAILVGSQIKRWAWWLLGIMLFFTGLTAFTVITGKVTDCGCFGDAITLTPVQTFIKDLVLLALAGFIFAYRHSIKPLFNPKYASRTTWLAGGLTVMLSVYCYNYLPILDFRPYKVDNNIQQLMNDGEPGEYKTVMVYKNTNTGTTKKVTTEEVGDLDQDVWKYQSREDEVIDPGKPATIQDFSISTKSGENITERVLQQSQPVVIIVSHHLSKSKRTVFEQLKKLDKSCSDVEFMVLTASPDEEVNKIREKYGVDFPFHFTDAITLKTIIRSNPGLVLLKKGTVKGKWHYNSLPNCEKLQQKLKL
jgi:hypothetical protein